MTSPFRRFPDTARAVAKILEVFATPVPAGARTGIRFPANLTGLTPFIRVIREGGRADTVTDYARLAVDVLDTDYTRGDALAQRILTHLEGGRLRHGGIVLDTVTCDSAPQQLPDWAPGIYRFQLRLTVTSRRYTTA